MRKKVILFIIISMMVIASSAYMIFNNTFSLANQIDYPNEKYIISFSALYDNEPIELSEMALGSILVYIKTAEPTRKRSLNDIPDTRPYFEVIIDKDDGQYKYFIYEKSNTIYLEIPYYGIYVVDDYVLDLLR
ncbi:MAG: DUF5301 domain-containing protein [bacterium]